MTLAFAGEGRLHNTREAEDRERATPASRRTFYETSH